MQDQSIPKPNPGNCTPIISPWTTAETPMAVANIKRERVIVEEITFKTALEPTLTNITHADCQAGADGNDSPNANRERVVMEEIQYQRALELAPNNSAYADGQAGADGSDFQGLVPQSQQDLVEGEAHFVRTIRQSILDERNR